MESFGLKSRGTICDKPERRGVSGAGRMDSRIRTNAASESTERRQQQTSGVRDMNRNMEPET
jgi:hypothetical protein